MKKATNSNSRNAPLCIESNEPILLGINACLEAVFPDEHGRPSRRSFDTWRHAGYFPQVVVGRRVFLDPIAVRRALMKRFTLQAID